jgi:hypothetical protein
MLRELKDRFLEFLGDRGPLLMQWITDAFAKIVDLQFHELTADEIAFFLACVVIVALTILKLARMAAAPQR